jgi:alkanesulfonate monooxygenase SsuD/methylene tetrahydromethanopterin reductase-like flavin-dependent oxidoreductase (luciferase family)
MHDPLTLLAAVAARTTRLRLTTNILVAPTRDPVLLAKAAATLHSLSGGRFTLGMAVGARPDDYAAVGVPFDGRGARFDAMLATMRAIWREELVNGAKNAIAAEPVDVSILIGGHSDRGARRVAQWAQGWTAGCAAVEQVAAGVERVHTAWAAQGRKGKPWLLASAYFALGDPAGSLQNTTDYYRVLSPHVAEEVAATALRDEAAIVAHAHALEQLGVDEFVLEPTVTDLAQITRAAGCVRL